MIRLGTPADLTACSGVYRRASLSNAGDRDNLLAHPEYLAGGAIELEDLFVDPDWRRRGIATALVGHIVDVLRARGVRCLEVTANPHAQGFYAAAGFVDCGVAETAFGPSPRKRLTID